jgi:hypothetical protein
MAFSSQYKIPYVETSALDSTNIDFCFKKLVEGKFFYIKK